MRATTRDEGFPTLDNMSTPPVPPPSAPYPPAGYPIGGPPPAPSTTNGVAIVAFILGILGFAVLPVVLGHVALVQIRRRNEGGAVFAIIGLVLGYVAVAVYTVLILLLVAGGLTWWFAG